MALSIGFGNSISLLPAIQATRLLTFASVGLPPTEHTCFFLVALPYGRISQVRNLGLSSMGLPSLARFKRWFTYAPLPWFAHSLVPPHASAYRQLCVWLPRC